MRNIPPCCLPQESAPNATQMPIVVSFVWTVLLRQPTAPVWMVVVAASTHQTVVKTSPVWTDPAWLYNRRIVPTGPMMMPMGIRIVRTGMIAQSSKAVGISCIAPVGYASSAIAVMWISSVEGVGP